MEDRELLEQWRKVLRLKIGGEVILFDGKGNEASAKIANLDRNFGEVEILGVSKNKNEPQRHVVLYCSILKRENFELVAQKATEVGVSEIVPIVAARTEKFNLRTDRLSRVVKEAAEQSGRASLPSLHPSVEFLRALAAAKANDVNLFSDPSGRNFRDFRFAPSDRRFGVWVGPEGGWTEEEVSLARTEGLEIIGLGPLTLRAETAAIVATYLTTNY